MRSFASFLNCTSLALGLPLLAACSFHRAPGVMGVTENGVQESGTPHIALIEHPMRADGVVDADFQLDGAGYAMVIAVDLDGRVKVVYPEAPSSAGLLLANDTHRIEPFYAGIGSGVATSPYWDQGYSYWGSPFYRSQFSSFQPGMSRARGAVYLVAIVSAQPLQFNGIRDASGEWDANALHSVVFDPDVSFVGARLGRLVTLPNQEFSTDYRVIADGRASPLYVSSAYGGCGRIGYGRGYDAGYYSSPIFGFDPYLSRSTFFLGGIGNVSSRYAGYSNGDLCRPTYIWTQQPEEIRRPSPLFPNDTSLLFTTRRIAERVPGAGGGSLTPFLPSYGAGEVRVGGPELSRGTGDRPAARTATPARTESPARGDGSARGESHGGGERGASPSGSARAGQRH
jgi:hypothetical protein